MKNKLLIEISIPSIDEDIDLYIPLNKNIANIIVLIGKAVSELKRLDGIKYDNFSLYNAETSLVYSPELIIRETNIRNGTKLVLM